MAQRAGWRGEWMARSVGWARRRRARSRVPAALFAPEACAEKNRPDEGRAGCRSAVTPAALCAGCEKAHRRQLPTGGRTFRHPARGALRLAPRRPRWTDRFYPPLSGPNGSEALRPRGSRRRWGHSDPRRAGRDDRGLDRRTVVASHAADAAPPLRPHGRLRKTPLAASGSGRIMGALGKRGDKCAHPQKRESRPSPSARLLDARLRGHERRQP
jgi:hypothetical protein